MTNMNMERLFTSCEGGSPFEQQQLTEQVSHKYFSDYWGVLQVTPQRPSEPLSPALLPLPGLHIRHLTLAHQTAFQVKSGPWLTEGGGVKLQQWTTSHRCP